jgi:hypothetical protein
METTKINILGAVVYSLLEKGARYDYGVQGVHSMEVGASTMVYPYQRIRLEEWRRLVASLDLTLEENRRLATRCDIVLIGGSYCNINHTDDIASLVNYSAILNWDSIATVQVEEATYRNVVVEGLRVLAGDLLHTENVFVAGPRVKLVSETGRKKRRALVNFQPVGYPEERMQSYLAKLREAPRLDSRADLVLREVGVSLTRYNQTYQKVLTEKALRKMSVDQGEELLVAQEMAAAFSKYQGALYAFRYRNYHPFKEDIVVAGTFTNLPMRGKPIVSMIRRSWKDGDQLVYPPLVVKCGLPCCDGYLDLIKTDGHYCIFEIGYTVLGVGGGKRRFSVVTFRRGIAGGDLPAMSLLSRSNTVSINGFDYCVMSGVLLYRKFGEAGWYACRNQAVEISEAKGSPDFAQGGFYRLGEGFLFVTKSGVAIGRTSPMLSNIVEQRQIRKMAALVDDQGKIWETFGVCQVNREPTSFLGKFTVMDIDGSVLMGEYTVTNLSIMVRVGRKETSVVVEATDDPRELLVSPRELGQFRLRVESRMGLAHNLIQATAPRVPTTWFDFPHIKTSRVYGEHYTMFPQEPPSDMWVLRELPKVGQILTREELGLVEHCCKSRETEVARYYKTMPEDLHLLRICDEEGRVVLELVDSYTRYTMIITPDYPNQLSERLEIKTSTLMSTALHRFDANQRHKLYGILPFVVGPQEAVVPWYWVGLRAMEVLVGVGQAGLQLRTSMEDREEVRRSLFSMSSLAKAGPLVGPVTRGSRERSQARGFTLASATENVTEGVKMLTLYNPVGPHNTVSVVKAWNHLNKYYLGGNMPMVIRTAVGAHATLTEENGYYGFKPPGDLSSMVFTSGRDSRREQSFYLALPDYSIDLADRLLELVPPDKRGKLEGLLDTDIMQEAMALYSKNSQMVATIPPDATTLVENYLIVPAEALPTVSRQRALDAGPDLNRGVRRFVRWALGLESVELYLLYLSHFLCYNANYSLELRHRSIHANGGLEVGLEPNETRIEDFDFGEPILANAFSGSSTREVLDAIARLGGERE